VRALARSSTIPRTDGSSQYPGLSGILSKPLRDAIYAQYIPSRCLSYVNAVTIRRSAAILAARARYCAWSRRSVIGLLRHAMSEVSFLLTGDLVVLF